MFDFSFHDALIQWGIDGLVNASWWQIVLYTLLLTHITIASVTIFLHRAQAHRSLELHAIPSHFFRFWLWLTTATVTKQWVAVHRKHHAKCETAEDPHSPVAHGIKTVLLTGSELYRAEAKVQDTLDKYGHNTPDDWLERNLYTRYSWQGVGLMLIINLALFGAIGLAVWAVQMAWIPVMATGVINGIGHYWGYRNFEAADASTNISPWGIAEPHHAGDHLALANLDHAGGFEVAKPVSQQICRDAGQSLAQFSIPRRTHQELADDQQIPPIAHNIQGPGKSAVLTVVSTHHHSLAILKFT